MDEREIFHPGRGIAFHHRSELFPPTIDFAALHSVIAELPRVEQADLCVLAIGERKQRLPALGINKTPPDPHDRTIQETGEEDKKAGYLRGRLSRDHLHRARLKNQRPAGFRGTFRIDQNSALLHRISIGSIVPGIHQARPLKTSTNAPHGKPEEHPLGDGRSLVFDIARDTEAPPEKPLRQNILAMRPGKLPSAEGFPSPNHHTPGLFLPTSRPRMHPNTANALFFPHPDPAQRQLWGPPAKSKFLTASK